MSEPCGEDSLMSVTLPTDHIEPELNYQVTQLAVRRLDRLLRAPLSCSVSSRVIVLPPQPRHRACIDILAATESVVAQSTLDDEAKLLVEVDGGGVIGVDRQFDP